MQKIVPKEMSNKIIKGDCLKVLKKMDEKSVQTCITSPPYWGLRDYGVKGQLGLEKTPEEFVAKMVEIFREVRRVLRDDGTLWLNLGDTYNGSKIGNTEKNKNPKAMTDSFKKELAPGLKPKDLVGIPWRVALALQADGWYLRSDIIWHKPNPMPESVTDRPTKSHEYIFLMSKNQKYYYDSDAIREKQTEGWLNRTKKSTKRPAARLGGSWKKAEQTSKEYKAHEIGRNKRSVWTVSTQPYEGAHFAVFPEDLIAPCILAGTSQEGNCKKCGSPSERKTEITKSYDHVTTAPGKSKDGPYANQTGDGEGTHDIRHGVYSSSKTLGWELPCKCGVGTDPAIVLDPFTGSGTTLALAKKLNRQWLGIELNPEYITLAEERIAKVTPPML